MLTKICLKYLSRGDSACAEPVILFWYGCHLWVTKYELYLWSVSRCDTAWARASATAAA